MAKWGYIFDTEKSIFLLAAMAGVEKNMDLTKAEIARFQEEKIQRLEKSYRVM
jgi:hypothetical protein